MGLGSILGGVGNILGGLLGGGSSGGGGSIGSIFGSSGNQKPYNMAQFGPFSNLQEATYNRNAQGAPNYDVLDQYGNNNAVPRANQPTTGQFVPGAPGMQSGMQGMFMDNQPLQQPQQMQQPRMMASMPQTSTPQGYPQLQPQTSGAFSMPQYRGMDDVTKHQSVWDRFPSLAQSFQNGDGGGTPWNNNQTPRWQQALAFGFTPWQQRQKVEAQGLQQQKMQADIAQSLASADASDQQGLNYNTHSYGNIADTYRKERIAPYEQRTEYNQGTHQFQLGEQARTAAGHNMAETQTENALRQPKVSSEMQQAYQRQQSGLRSAAGTQTENEIRPYKINTAKAGATIKGAEADVAPQMNQAKLKTQQIKATPPAAKPSGKINLNEYIDRKAADRLSDLSTMYASRMTKATTDVERKRYEGLLSNTQAQLESLKKEAGGNGGAPETRTATPSAGKADWRKYLK